MRSVVLGVISWRPLIIPPDVVTLVLCVTLMHIVKLHHFLNHFCLLSSDFDFGCHLSQAGGRVSDSRLVRVSDLDCTCLWKISDSVRLTIRHLRSTHTHNAALSLVSSQQYWPVIGG